MRPALGESARLYHQTPGEESHKQSDKNIGRVTSLAEDAQVGYRFQTSVTRVLVSGQLPAFWLAAGAEDRQDVGAAVSFRQLLQTWVASVRRSGRPRRSGRRRMPPGPAAAHPGGAQGALASPAH